MKRFWFYVIIGVLSSGVNPAFGQQLRNNKATVLLDPGHGGSDSGAVGINGINEKDVALKVAKETIRLNRELYNGSLDIYLTRYTDTLISLGHRTKLAKTLKVDVFISIHCNQARRKAAQGIEVYINQDNEQSAQLAQKLATGFNKKLGFKNRGVKQANFQVLRETSGFCPSVLLELGFLSNREEARHNTKRASMTAYALLILQTLIAYSYD